MQGKDLIPLSLSLPRSQGIIGARPKIFAFCVLVAHVGRFFRLPERALEKRQRKNTEKNTKIKDFGLPKPSQNQPEMPSKSMSHKTCIFSAIFGLFGSFSASCAFSSKCLKPSKNCGFVVLRAFQQCALVGT